MINLFLFLNGYSSGKSGADIAAIEVVKRLTGINKTTITSKNGTALCRSMGLNGEFIITSHENKFSNVFIKYIQRTIKTLLFKPVLNDNDILYSSSDVFPDVIPCFFWKSSNNKWIQLIYHVCPNYFKRSGNIVVNFVAYHLQKLSFFLIKKKADKIITASNILKKEFVKIGFNKSKIFVIPIGIETNYFAKIKSFKNKYNCVYLGRLNYSKGIFDLIKIWEKVVKTIPKAKLAIIGEGSNEIKEKLISEIHRSKLKNNVDFLGYLNDKEAFSIIKSSDLFIYPSHEEGFGITITEVMATGIPVISWDLKIYDEIFKDNIIKIKENDYNLFSKTIINLLKDKDKRILIINKAKKHVKQYDWINILPKYLEVIKNSNLKLDPRFHGDDK